MREELERESSNDEEGYANFERGPGFFIDIGIHSKLLLRDQVLCVHLLCKLKIEERNFVACKVTCQGHIHSLASVSQLPLWVVVCLGAIISNFVHKVLCLLK